MSYLIALLVLNVASRVLMVTTAEPGPTPVVTVFRRYGWLMVTGGLALAVLASLAVLRPRYGLAGVLTTGAALTGAWSLGLEPTTVVRRVVLRSRWVSVARAAGLGVTKDRRSSEWPGGAVLEGLTADIVEHLPTLHRGRRIPGGVRYRLTPARGATVEHVAEQAEALAAGLHVGLVEVIRHAPDRGTLSVYWRAVVPA